MYTPKYFKEEDLDTIQQLIDSNGFGILISQLQGKIWATHVPMELERINNRVKLFGHISKANKQWKEFSDNQEVLAIFQGAHAYISPSWYNHENVPTWNYQAVHLYGTIKPIEGDSLKERLSEMVDKYEKSLTNPVHLSNLAEEYVDKHILGIVGFEITVTEIQGAAKLSQNRDDESYEGIIKGLSKKNDANSQEMADIMRKRR